MQLKKILFAAALPAMFMASCSNEADGPTPPDTPGFKADGYMAVKVNMPAQPGSRAANDNFDDGTVNEYEVTDGALLLFTGSDEASAQFVAAYDLGMKDPVNDSDNDNITTSFLEAVKVQNVDVQGNLYALVMLNYKDVATVDANAPANLVVEGNAFAGTFTDFNALISGHAFHRGSGKSAEYFFMTNAPIANKQGGLVSPAGLDVTTLTLLNENCLYPTEAEAKASPAGSVFVERAVAKATLGVAATQANVEGKVLKIESVEWALANTENTSYVVRNLGDQSYNLFTSGKLSTPNYRFIGHTAIGTTAIQPVTALYRTYWCVDPAYSVDKTYTEVAGSFVGTDVPLYCHENTFTVANQNYKNTTRAVLKVKYEGGSFWTVNDRQDKIYDNFNDAKSFSDTFIYESQAVIDAIKDAMNAGQSVGIDWIKENVEITYALDGNGIQKVTDIAFKAVTTGDVFKAQPTFRDGAKEALIAKTNEYYSIAEYTDGVSYYDLRFQHFGNDLTPWTAPTAGKTDNTSDSYPGLSAEDYLGRYGMVRNNWYDVSVNSFKRLGLPVIPNANVETPDDNVNNELWLAFKVNILSWAKRTQNQDF